MRARNDRGLDLDLPRENYAAACCLVLYFINSKCQRGILAKYPVE